MGGTFTVIADDDFSRLDPNSWGLYSGVSGASGCTFDPAGVTVKDGTLRLTAAPPARKGAGVRHRTDQTYGRWTVLSRIESGRGVTLVHLLWPAAGQPWPPEVDFAEDNGGDRNTITATTHWKDTAGAHRRDQSTLAVDLTQWHTWQVTWTPGLVTCACDGTVYATSSNAPTVPMHLALQTEVWQPGGWYPGVDAITPAAVSTWIDRVTVESWAP